MSKDPVGLLTPPSAQDADTSPYEWEGFDKKENGETGFLVSPLRTHLRRAFVALAAGRGWPQPFAGPRVAGELRDPRPPSPSSGRVRSMRMDRSHRTPVPVSRRALPSRGGAILRRRRLRRGTPEAHQQLSPPRETLRSLSPSAARSSRTPNFVGGNICLRRAPGKAENRTVPVSQWDKGDSFADHTTEGGARGPDALNPAPR